MRQNSNKRIGTLLGRNWWTLALRGAIAILFGIAVFIWPAITLATLVILFGAFVFMGGVLALIAALRNRRLDEERWLLLFEGLLGIAVAVLVFIWPRITGVVLTYLIAGWAIFTGLLEITAAIALRKEIQNEWLLGLAGIASLIFGILIAIFPLAGALAIVWVIGAYAIVFGVTLLILAFRLRNWHRQGPPPI